MSLTSAEMRPRLIEVLGSDAQRSSIERARGAARGFFVEVEPPARRSVVVLLTRRDGKGLNQAYLPREWSPGAPEALYRVIPPHPRPGETVDYRLELRRDGQCLANLPVDGSWSTLIGPSRPAASEPDSAQSPLGIEHFGARPLWTHRLEYFATLIAEVRADVIGATPDGYRVNFACNHGRLRGPTIDAVEIGGTDYVCVRPDGVALLHKAATWRTSDGALIQEEGTGLTDLGPDGYERIASGTWTGQPPVTIASLWSTAAPAWQWLTRVETVAIGHTIASNLQLQLDFYVPSLDGGSSDA